MSDDEPIRFDDAAMFAAPPRRPPVLAPVVRPTPPISNTPAVMVPRCPQCGFAYGLASHSRMVWKNRQQVEMTFCSEACGADYQIGSEG